MCKITSVLLKMVLLAILTDIIHGFYIKKEEAKKPKEITIDRNTLDQSWSMFNRGNQQFNLKDKLFRKEKQQPTALEKFLKMMNQNKKSNAPISMEKQNAKKDVRNLFDTLLTLAKEELKQSTLKSLNRPRRRISLQLVSDIPSEKIDELLKVFVEENKVNNVESEIEDPKQHDDDDDVDDDDDDDYDDDNSYSNFNMERDSHDYAYDNFMAAPGGSKSNSEYGSIQDLILQATKSQWEREHEDNFNANDHFV